MYVCQYCRTEYHNLQNLDYSNEGFFCDICDSFTYFENAIKQHQFNLFLEENGHNQKLNNSNKKIKKHLSPLRYPGGKNKILPLLYQNIKEENTKYFVEPFAGGGGVGLALLEANIIEKYILNDIDYGIYALFKTIKENPNPLINKIKTTSLSHEDFFKARSSIQKFYDGCNLFEAAWNLLIVNRLAYSGITKANPLGGKNGTKEQLLSRWNPKQLINKIEKIHSISDKIEVTNKDGLEVIEEYYWTPKTTIFIDPPYYKKGKQLYTYYYGKAEHTALKNLLFSLSVSCPGADILLTYDNDVFIKNLYWWAPTKKIKQQYSV